MWDPMDEIEDCDCARMVNSSFTTNERCNTERSYNRPSCLDKENIASGLKNESDLSFYNVSSPSRPRHYCNSPIPPLPLETDNGCSRLPLDVFDPNSQDSGYGQSFTDKVQPTANYFQFAPPISSALGNVRESFNQRSAAADGLRHDSFGSMDEDFIYLMDSLPGGENVHSPSSSFNQLIEGSLQKPTTVVEESSRPMILRRCLSEFNTNNTPSSSRAQRLANIHRPAEIQEMVSLKRAGPSMQVLGPSPAKRAKTTEDDNECAEVPNTLQRSLSVTEESIRFALQRSVSNPDLTGDFSKPCSLPLITGRHQDLKSITAVTLMMLMKGQFRSVVSSFTIIDCRYPYEFVGGHIDGAINCYTKEQVAALLEAKDGNAFVEPDKAKRNVIIFHCEFSSQRGPNLSRYLRNLDRSCNGAVYPALHYPEIYLLDGGYKSFFESCSEFCTPNAYKPMCHPAHAKDLRHFRAKSKTWNVDTKISTAARPSFTRLKRLDFC